MNGAIQIALMLVAGLSGGGASAMTSADSAIHCSIQRADKLPPGIDADFICNAIRTAAVPALQQARLAPADLSVRVTVQSSSRVAAATTVAGQALPEHHLGTSDRPLNARAISMLASAIATDVAALRR